MSTCECITFKVHQLSGWRQAPAGSSSGLKLSRLDSLSTILNCLAWFLSRLARGRVTTIALAPKRPLKAEAILNFTDSVCLFSSSMPFLIFSLSSLIHFSCSAVFEVSLQVLHYHSQFNLALALALALIFSFLFI